MLRQVELARDDKAGSSGSAPECARVRVRKDRKTMQVKAIISLRYETNAIQSSAISMYDLQSSVSDHGVWSQYEPSSCRTKVLGMS